MDNNLTRYQNLLLRQVILQSILQSIAESMRDAIKLHPLSGSLQNAPLMEINVEIQSKKDDDKTDDLQHNNSPKQEKIALSIKSTIPNNEMPLSLEDDYFGTRSYNSDDSNVWDPLNIPESDVTSILSSSTVNELFMPIQSEDDRASSPELGVPHPLIFRKSNFSNSRSK
ncbi:unnamed protein product [Meloidogyne enterolobii]|uniref:Uncharacterized protein n=1 Tax=Meloidogyne enterolobii TaxID=390850 RepID=A0ACB0YNI4_MELEN